MPQPPATVDDLGMQGCLSLWALLTGQDQRLPIAPTTRMAMLAMDMLREQGVIDVPWPSRRWEAQPAAEETPLEGLQWVLTWPVYERDHLCAALEDYFQSIAKDELGMALKLSLWIEIGAGEVESFFQQQLVKHHLPEAWTQDIGFVYAESHFNLTLAQWRYCGWAAVRRGASLSLQQGNASESVREVIYREIRQRAVAIGTGDWVRCALPPFQPRPASALARGFTGQLSNLGTMYWNVPASVDALYAATER